MKRGAVIAVVVTTAALVGASSAAAEVTQEDRDFAAAVRAFDAQTLAVTRDPAVLEAMRARQQAATACLDAARSLGTRRDGMFKGDPGRRRARRGGVRPLDD